LARIHHEAFGDLARGAAPAIVGHLRRAGLPRGLVVDLGCGSGILARHLVKSGYDVLGVDPSPEMLRIASHLRRHIARVSAALVPGGLFIFDAIHEGDAALMTYRTWRAGRDWAVLSDVSEDPRRHVVTRRITAFVRQRSAYRRSDAEHRVGVYAKSEVLRQLRAHGFSVRTLHDYGSPLPPRRLVFLARLTGHRV
jgi:Methyltransferase domain